MMKVLSRASAIAFENKENIDKRVQIIQPTGNEMSEFISAFSQEVSVSNPYDVREPLYQTRESRSIFVFV